MKHSNRGGLDLYQQKEPAFSREQRKLLVPKVLYIPVTPGADEKQARAFLDNVIFLGIFDIEYPGVSHTKFGRYKLSAATGMGADENEDIPDYDGDKPMLIKSVDIDDLINIARRAFIVDETDGVPLFKKLQEFKERKGLTLVLDAIDEEPYVSSSINTLLQKGAQVMDTLRLMADALHTKDVFAVCYADMDDTRTVVPNRILDIDIHKIGGRYPVRKRLRQQLMSKKLGKNFGLVGTQAMLHLYRALYFGKKQSTTIVTVAGDCVGYSCNVEVTIGTTLGELLEFCRLLYDPAQVVIKGSMCGISMENLNVPILHSTKAVLAFRKEKPILKLPCVNCGKCISVCPSGLSPTYMYKYAKTGQMQKAFDLRPEECIECACCSYICPARLDLYDAMVTLKRHKRDFAEQKLRLEENEGSDALEGNKDEALEGGVKAPSILSETEEVSRAESEAMEGMFEELEVLAELGSLLEEVEVSAPEEVEPHE